mgnify:CR=1 FL=1
MDDTSREDTAQDDYPPVEIVKLEDQVVPDNSFDDAYAIYLRLSYEPPLAWQETFEALMEQEVRHRITSFVGARLRVVISRRDNLEMVLRQMNRLVRKANIQHDFLGEE